MVTGRKCLRTKLKRVLTVKTKLPSTWKLFMVRATIPLLTAISGKPLFGVIGSSITGRKTMCFPCRTIEENGHQKSKPREEHGQTRAIEAKPRANQRRAYRDIVHCRNQIGSHMHYQRSNESPKEGSYHDKTETSVETADRLAVCLGLCLELLGMILLRKWFLDGSVKVILHGI